MTENLALLESLALANSPARTPVPVMCEIVRELTGDDLPLVVQELKERNWSKANARPAGAVTTLRLGHHQLAQLLAAKTDPVAASLATGRSVASVKALLDDPSFQELMAYYAEQQEGRDFNAYDRLVLLGGTAMDVLQDRLENSPDKFSNNELRQIMESTMDRSAAPAKGGVFGPAGSGKGQGLNLQINFVQAKASAPPLTIEVTKVEEENEHAG